MYMIVKIDEELNHKQAENIKAKIEGVLHKSGYNYKIFELLSHGFIEAEIANMSKNHINYELDRELTNSEVEQISKKIFNEYDGIFSDLLDVADLEINSVIIDNDGIIEKDKDDNMSVITFTHKTVKESM